MLTPILFFGLALTTICALLWTGVALFKPRENPLENRLDELQNNAMTAAAGGKERRTHRGPASRFLNIVGSIPGGDDWIKGSEKRLRQAGYRGESALGVYMMIAVAALAISLGGMLFLQRNNPAANLFGGMIAAGIIGFVGPQFVLGKLATRYRKHLQEALPDTVDLLGIVLGTGLALDQAMLRVSEEMQYIYPELANEFYTVVMQVRAGQERAKAFNAMVRRTGIDDVKALSAMIIQSERFGTSLSQALKVYADALRTRRRLRAEAAVGRAAIKMLFPIVVFILPALFVITLVPGMLSVLQNLDLLGGGGAR
jgi:tight adherence protein C